MSVPIEDDYSLEPTETFAVVLEVSSEVSSRFSVDPSVKVINITDNDGMLYLGNM